MGMGKPLKTTPTPPVPFPTRPVDAYKKTAGLVLAVAGCRGYTGAAYLTSLSALRAGAGIVTLVSPESAQRVLEAKTTCVITAPLPETSKGTLSRAALKPLLEHTAKKHSVVIGPGLSSDEDTQAVVREYLETLAKDEGGPTIVLDADGFNPFEGERVDGLAPLAERLVLTPHAGEFMRLAGLRHKDELARDRTGTLVEFVQRVGAVTILKGPGSLVARRRSTGDVEVHVNDTGNPGMATAGSGDVLAGIIAALLAAGQSPWDAARLGTWLHGRAGDLAARRTGWAPLIATDIIEGLIEAIREIETRD